MVSVNVTITRLLSTPRANTTTTKIIHRLLQHNNNKLLRRRLTNQDASTSTGQRVLKTCASLSPIIGTVFRRDVLRQVGNSGHRTATKVWAVGNLVRHDKRAIRLTISNSTRHLGRPANQIAITTNHHQRHNTSSIHRLGNNICQYLFSLPRGNTNGKTKGFLFPMFPGGHHRLLFQRNNRRIDNNDTTLTRARVREHIIVMEGAALQNVRLVKKRTGIRRGTIRTKSARLIRRHIRLNGIKLRRHHQRAL